MKRVPRVLAVMSLSSGCSPAIVPPVDAGHDSGTPANDAGLDAGYDAGVDGGRDAGTDGGPNCPAACVRPGGGCLIPSNTVPWPNCVRPDGGCVLPLDFPVVAQPYEGYEACECQPNPVTFCADETSLRCESWACQPGKESDGGVQRLPDGGVLCLC